MNILEKGAKQQKFLQNILSKFNFERSGFSIENILMAKFASTAPNSEM